MAKPKRRYRSEMLGDVVAACRAMKIDPAMEILHEMTENADQYEPKFRVETFADLLQYVAPKKRSQDTTIHAGDSLAAVLSGFED